MSARERPAGQEGALSWIWSGYDKKSAGALVTVLCVYVAVGYRWQHLIDPSRGMDWLLAGIWTFMTLLLIWRLDTRQDLRLVFVGLVGGAVIEWWGTTTTLWWYFTAERPPLWIIPAWPTAALTIHRLPSLIGRAWPGIERLGRAYWLALPLFCLAMTRFLWPTIHVLSSQVVVLLMIGVILVGARPNRDFSIFVTGTMLGFFLEYWGTSRHCWTYYTREIPPVEAVFAHGFAAVAFARMDQLLVWVIGGGPFKRPAPARP
jgi:hypothetical protein